MNLEPYGIPRNMPIKRLMEAAVVIRKLWNATYDQPANFNGQFYTLKEAFLQIKPIQKPYPPIYMAAGGPLARKAVAKLANGWLTLAHSPETLKEDIEKMKEELAVFGRKMDEIDTAVWLYTAVSKDRFAAKKAVIHSGGAALLLVGETLKKLGFAEYTKEDLTLSRLMISKKSMKRFWKAVKSIPETTIEETVVFGTPDDCIERFEDFFKIGVRHIIVFNCGPNLSEALNYFKKYIIPYFKDNST